MPYIELLGRGDRLGANITTFIAQTIYAHKNNLEIRYNRNFINSGDDVKHIPFNQDYLNSIFIETLLDFIDIHNSKLLKDELEVKFYTIHFFELMSKVVLDVKMDLVSYFKKYIFNSIIDIFKEKYLKKDYKIPFDVETTVVVHLRLDDVRWSPDYDGRLCTKEFTNYLNDDKITTNELDFYVKNKYGRQYNRQSPIPFNRIESYLSEIKLENPNYNVVLVTSQGENLLNLPYKVFSNNDESYDLFLLCCAKKVILSRSTFSLVSMFFGESEKYYVPLWGHIPCFGLYTKFDNNKNINFIY
jgi:hypothetical protein